MAEAKAKDALHLRPVASLADWSLPAWIYSDAEFFALERDMIFRRAWQVVCHVNDVPKAGDYFTYRLLNERIVVLRDKDGALKAFHNVCRHRASRLLDGDQGHCGGRITCPYHSWSYGLDGRLIAVPERQEYERFNVDDFSLFPVELEVFLGFVFVRIDGGGASVADLFQPVRDEIALYRPEEMTALSPIRERTRHVNWKVAVDNYIDALHVRAAHPGLNSIVGQTYTLEVRGQISRLWGTADKMGHAGPSVRAYCKYLPAVAHLPESHRRLWVYYQAWPNVTVNIYPDMIEIMTFLPLTPTSCIIRDACYGHADDRREMRAARYLNYRVNRGVNVEDKDLIERVQDGMGSSSYTMGPLGSHEVCLRALATHMRDVLPVSRLHERPAPGTVAARNAEMTHQ